MINDVIQSDDIITLIEKDNVIIQPSDNKYVIIQPDDRIYIITQLDEPPNIYGNDKQCNHPGI
jgi:hypothetical protein